MITAPYCSLPPPAPTRSSPRTDGRGTGDPTELARGDGKLYVKGAVEVVLPVCASGTENAAEANAGMARQGLRVLAVAVGEGAGEANLTLLGLVGIADPPRTEAIAAVALARAAGIKTVMITGDHPVTAEAIGRELGILTPRRRRRGHPCPGHSGGQAPHRAGV